MIDRRSRSWFEPDDPDSVHANFKRIVARSMEKEDAALRDIRPMPPAPRAPRLIPARKRASP